MRVILLEVALFIDIRGVRMFTWNNVKTVDEVILIVGLKDD